jgi:hypothetical protein
VRSAAIYGQSKMETKPTHVSAHLATFIFSLFLVFLLLSIGLAWLLYNSMFRYLLVDHAVPAMWRSLAKNPAFSFGE